MGRSACPVSSSLDVLGDRWSLLIVRDMMVRAFRSFSEFLRSGEGIASNILSDRLRKLERAGIIAAERDEADRRKVSYRLTEKGIDLAPLLLELLIWGARHEGTSNTAKGQAAAFASQAQCARIEQMIRQRDALLAEVRRRWQEHDPHPLQAADGRWLWP